MTWTAEKDLKQKCVCGLTGFLKVLRKPVEDLLLLFFDSAYMFKEAATNLTQMWLLLVELLLEIFEELPLESVDLFDIPKDGTKLLFSEHVCPFAALFDVTLRDRDRRKTC